MRLARSDQFDNGSPPWLHCVSRCVRRAFLCGEGFEHRREWIEKRIQLLATHFAVDLAAYAVMSNHLHVVIRPQPQQAAEWTARQVAEVWHRIKNADIEGKAKPVLPTQDPEWHIDSLAADEEFVATWRERFSSASWFMKTLKEPIARAANREDQCTGAFWEGRFSSTPLLDEAALITCMAYVDLNPIRASISSSLEESEHTSAKQRIEQGQARKRAGTLAKKDKASKAKEVLHEAQLRLRPGHQIGSLDSDRDDQAVVPWLKPLSGILGEYDPSFGPSQYLRILDVTGRIIRGDKRGAIPAGTAAILDRLQCDHEQWIETMSRPKSLMGAALGHMAAREQEAIRRCCRWLQVRCPLFA